MGKLWQLMGPEEDVLTFEQVAKLFGYEPDSLARLIDHGLFPAPRGVGRTTYYTGDDVAAIRLLLGRWQPRPKAELSPEKPGPTRKKSDKPGETRPEPESEG